MVPPPSPVPAKPKPKLKRRTLLNNRSPVASRKPLQLCRATLELSVAREISTNISVSETSIDSDSDSDVVNKEKIKPVRRRRKKKKAAKKKQRVREISPHTFLILLKNGQLGLI